MTLAPARPARAGEGDRRGLVLTLPSLRGTDADMAGFVRHALPGHPIWAAGIDLGGATLADPAPWLGLVAHVVDAILSGRLAAPAALAGFSIGGYLGWLIDRRLVAAGRAPTPVINLDGGAMHLHRAAWRDAVGALVPDGAGLAPARMLLLHSADPEPLRLFDSAWADWERLGVPVCSVPCRTLDHPDCKRPATIRMAAPLFGHFVEHGCLPADAEGRALEVDTIGGAVFRALVAPVPPTVAEVERLLGAGLFVNANMLAGVLFLAAATGEAAFALDVTRRVAVAAPRFRPAAYAAEALRRATGEARPWGSLRGVAIGSEEALDFAAGFCGAGEA